MSISTADAVILVDENDRVIGFEEKMKAHRQGSLHRAFSVFIVDFSRRTLLQKRASTKYHSRGLWSNTCCSHPRPNEPIEEAAHRRLKQEMGFDCDLEEIFQFRYTVDLENGMSENEYDHVFGGRFVGMPVPNLGEVEDWKWMSIEDLSADITEHPERYAYWLAACFSEVAERLDILSGQRFAVSGERQVSSLITPSAK